MDIEQQINKAIQDLAQFLLIDELSESGDALYIDSSPSRTKNQQLQTNNIASFLNPLYMTTARQQTVQSQEQYIRQCVKNSRQTENMELLLNNILDLPKLRYQESQKLFQLQTLQSKTVNPVNLIPKVLNFETPQQIDNLSTIRKNAQQTQYSQDMPHLQTSGSTPYNKLKLQFSQSQRKAHMNDSAQEQQSDIELNMSARSHHQIQRIQGRNQDARIFKPSNDRETPIKKINQNSKNSNVFFQTQSSQKKAKMEKNFIQNYFQSAKNQILENCSMDCCEGIFSKSHSNQSQVNSKNIKLKQDPNSHKYIKKDQTKRYH